MFINGIVVLTYLLVLGLVIFAALASTKVWKEK